MILFILIIFIYLSISIYNIYIITNYKIEEKNYIFENIKIITSIIIAIIIKKL